MIPIRQKKVVVTCEGCKRSVKLERCIKQKKLDRNLADVGIECPHCKHWTHSFYETPAIKRAREAIQAAPEGEREAAKKAFSKVYAAEQKRVAEELAK